MRPATERILILARTATPWYHVLLYQLIQASAQELWGVYLPEEPASSESE
jgi:hypothetical protein